MWRRNVAHSAPIIAVDIGHTGWRLNLIPDTVSLVVIDAVRGVKVIGAVVEVVRAVVEVVRRVIEVVQAVLEVVRAIVKVVGLLRIGTTACDHQRQ